MEGRAVDLVLKRIGSGRGPEYNVTQYKKHTDEDPTAYALGFEALLHCRLPETCST